MDHRDAEMMMVLNALTDCVREMTVARWGKPDSFMTLAEEQARELLAIYHGQYEEVA